MELPVPVWWIEYNHQVKQVEAIKRGSSPVRQKSGLSNAEWEEARRKHMEKQGG